MGRAAANSLLIALLSSVIATVLDLTLGFLSTLLASRFAPDALKGRR